MRLYRESLRGKSASRTPLESLWEAIEAATKPEASVLSPGPQLAAELATVERRL